MSESIELDFGNLPNWAKSVAVFDLETTGLDLKEARIVTAATAELDMNGSVVGELNQWLLNPGIEIPEAASNVHGITTEMAIASGEEPQSALAAILESLRGFFERGIPVVAYNAPYDFTILHFEALRYNLEPIIDPNPIFDPLVVDKFVDQYRKGKRTLEAGCQSYGVVLGEAHNASADAVAAGRLGQKIAARYAEKLPTDIQELHQAQITWSLNQDLSYEEFRQKTQPDFKVTKGWPVKI